MEEKNLTREEAIHPEVSVIQEEPITDGQPEDAG